VVDKLATPLIAEKRLRELRHHQAVEIRDRVVAIVAQ
jgi:hypothetical protein